LEFGFQPRDWGAWRRGRPGPEANEPPRRERGGSEERGGARAGGGGRGEAGGGARADEVGRGGSGGLAGGWRVWERKACGVGLAAPGKDGPVRPGGGRRLRLAQVSGTGGVAGDDEGEAGRGGAVTVHSSDGAPARVGGGARGSRPCHVTEGRRRHRRGCPRLVIRPPGTNARRGVRGFWFPPAEASRTFGAHVVRSRPRWRWPGAAVRAHTKAQGPENRPAAPDCGAGRGGANRRGNGSPAGQAGQVGAVSLTGDGFGRGGAGGGRGDRHHGRRGPAASRQAQAA